MKGKGIVKKFNGKCFIYSKTKHPVKDWKKKKNKGQKENPKKRIVEAIVTNADHSTNKFSEINLSYFVFEVNLINNSKKLWVDIVTTCHVCNDKRMFLT